MDSLIASFNAVIRAKSGERVNGKVASNRTQEIAEQVMSNCARRLHKMGFYLESAEGLSRKHIDALVTDWHHTDKLSAKTVQNQFSRLKIFCGWIGKGGIVSAEGAIGHLPGVDPKELKVKTYTDTSMSWSGNGVNVCKIIETALDEDERHGNMLRLTLGFGLRKKEDLKIKLWKADKGHALEIEGSVAKTGKFRSLPVDTSTEYGQWQRWILDEAKKLCGKNEPFGWPGRTYKQNENHYYYLNRKLGLTKLDLGVVGHGLRAEFFENQAMIRGMLPLALGGSPTQLPRSEMDRINLEVSQLGGHDDTHTIGAYYGSLRRPPKAPDRGARVGGLQVDADLGLMVGIYINPPVVPAADGSFRRLTLLERQQTEITLVKEQIGQVQTGMSLGVFLGAYPEMTQKLESTLKQIGL